MMCQTHNMSQSDALEVPGDLWSRIPARYAHSNPYRTANLLTTTTIPQNKAGSPQGQQDCGCSHPRMMQQMTCLWGLRGLTHDISHGFDFASLMSHHCSSFLLPFAPTSSEQLL